LDKDIIIWDGGKISAIEIENLMISHPRINSVVMAGLVSPIKKYCREVNTVLNGVQSAFGK